MSNPLSLFPIALAAGGGRVDGVPAPALVAAGFSLLQRSAPLVRAMAGRRSALLLPPSGAVLTALAASDGRGAVLLPLDAGPDLMGPVLAHADVGAVFTTRGLASQLPPGDHAVVLLDDAPRAATVIARGVETVVDLGSHFGLALEGEEDDGSDEECLVTYDVLATESLHGVVFTHRNVLALARGAVDATSMLAGDRVLMTEPVASLAAFALTLAAPLLAGAQVTTVAGDNGAGALAALERSQITMMAGGTRLFASILDAVGVRGHPLAAPALRVCVCIGLRPDAPLQARWLAQTGVELRHAFGIAEAPLALFNAPHFPNRHGTLGVPFPGVQVTVRDAMTGEEPPPGVVGALCLRGAQVAGSALRSHATASPVRDGWLITPHRAHARTDGAMELSE